MRCERSVATSQVLTTDLPLTIHESPTAWPYPLVGSGAFSFIFTHVDISRPIVLICRRTEWFLKCWLYTAVLLSMKSSWLLMFLYIKRRLFSLWCQHKINILLIHEVQDKSKHRLLNSRKTNNSRTHQLRNWKTHKLISSKILNHYLWFDNIALIFAPF